MNLADINGNLAVFGGISGFIVLVYMVLMLYWTREKDKHIQALRSDILIELALLKGMMLKKR